MQDSNILLVDDDSAASISLSRLLKAAGLKAKVNACSALPKALEFVQELRPEVAVIDLHIDDRLGVESGYSLLRDILRIEPCCRVIVLTGHGSTERGVRALALGAASFLQKPADVAHLLALVNDGIEQSKLKRAFLSLLREKHAQLDKIIVGKSEKINRVREELKHCAQTSQSVLFSGATGTGKGLCARALHDLSARANKRFVRFQPGVSGASLVASELFGHVKGAFTGADRERLGLFAEAQGGTLFLDEIDELPHETQVGLLGVLQERTFRPVGADYESKAEFRLVSASNADLNQALASGKLRNDLFHRLAQVEIKLPALNERSEDIPELVNNILSRLAEREELNVFHISEDALAVLLAREWPGNIRELEACVESAAYRAHFDSQPSIQIDHLPGAAGECEAENGQRTFSEKVREYKLKLIKEALSRNAGNKLRAAEELGLDRSSMRRILEREGFNA